MSTSPKVVAKPAGPRLRKVVAEPARPRASDADMFEQNPLHEPGKAPELRVLDEHQTEQMRVMEGVRRVVEDGADLRETARELGVAVSHLLEWKRKYFAFYEELTKRFEPVTVETEAGALPADLSRVSGEHQLRFADNWARLMEETHATEEDFQQEQIEVFLQNSRLTGWLYHDGKLDRGAFVGLVIGLMAMLAVPTYMLARRVVERRLAAHRPVPSPVTEGPAYEDTAAVVDQALEAAQTARQFLEADGWSGKIPYVQDGAARKDEIERFFRGSDLDRGLAVESEVVQPQDHGVFSVALRAPSTNAKYYFNVLRVGEKYYVHWDSSSLVQQHLVKRFVAERSTEPVQLCVRMGRGEYFNHQYSDPSKYDCYELTYPMEGQPILFGYIEKSSPQAGPLRTAMMLRQILASREVIVQKGDGALDINANAENQGLYPTSPPLQPIPVVLKVRYQKKGDEARQVEITEMVRDRWIESLED